MANKRRKEEYLIVHTWPEERGRKPAPTIMPGHSYPTRERAEEEAAWFAQNMAQCEAGHSYTIARWEY